MWGQDMNVGLVLTLWLLANIFAVEAWDLWAVYYVGDYHLTVSYWLASWASRFPIVAFAMGVVIGHLFWRIKVDGN